MKFLKTSPTAMRSNSTVLVFLSSLLLAGCAMDGAEIEDSYVATTAEERYPITVAEAPVKMNVSARSGTLQAEHLNRVINFAQDARNNATSRISVSYSSGSSNARKVAGESVAVLVAQGIPRNMIATGSYRGSSSMVTLAFHRKVAVTKECGDWSDNLSGNQFNEAYPNQGCAIQHNIAAMVANPEDFERPRSMTPVLGGARTVALKKYYTGETVDQSSSSSSSNSSPSSDPVSAPQ